MTGNKPGRPGIDGSISEAIIRMRKETGCGRIKVIQALRRLGHTTSRQTVGNFLVEAGLKSGDHRSGEAF